MPRTKKTETAETEKEIVKKVEKELLNEPENKQPEGKKT